MDLQVGAGVRFDEPPAWELDPYADVPHIADDYKQGAEGTDPFASLIVDLTPYLDGTYEPPQPARGVVREDGKYLLYPGRWHTLIGPTASGKSWFAAQCVFDELCAGRTVLYVHFEEATPAGTVQRMLDMGLPADLIRDGLVWLSTESKIDRNIAAALADRYAPALVVLDGINAACSSYGWPVNETIAVGQYRNALVTQFTAADAAVLSLGHPPKARDRQDERHGFGSSAWLDEVDGVGFRITPSKTQPIARGRVGYSNIATVKDRYGQVEALGQLSDTSEGWHDIGTLRVDSNPVDMPAVRVRVLQPGETRPGRDVVDALADEVVAFLADAPEGRFASLRDLEMGLRARRVTFRNGNTAVAVERLRQAGRIEWPEVTGERKPRPGRLIDPPTAPQGEE